VQLRPARAGDADALARLAGELGYPTTPAQASARLVRLENTEGALIVAEGGGEVVGWVHVFVSPAFETDPSAEIGGLVVAAERRGAGIGALLVRAAEDWGRARGFAEIRVRSNVVRERTHRFYESAGYAERKRQAVFVKTLR